MHTIIGALVRYFTRHHGAFLSCKVKSAKKMTRFTYDSSSLIVTLAADYPLGEEAIGIPRLSTSLVLENKHDSGAPNMLSPYSSTEFCN